MSQYYYLIASLPFLEFGIKPLISYDHFLAYCRGQLGISDIEVLERTTIEPPHDAKDASSTLREWKIFDTILRNEIAKQRASKMLKDPAGYVKDVDYQDPFLAASIHWVVNQESPIEAELLLDKIRWEKIEELSKGHYFDIDFLITYALKLQILERWQRINSEDGMRHMQDLVAA